MKDYWVVYTFHATKQAASKSLTGIKKKIPEASVEEDFDGGFVVSLGHFTSESSATKMVKEACQAGYWAGIYTPNISL